MSSFFADSIKNPVIKITSQYPVYILILSIGTFLLPFIYSDALVHKSELTKYIFIAFISISSFFFWFISTYRSNTNNIFYNPLFSLLLVIFAFAASSIFWNQFNGSYQIEIMHFSCLLLITFTSMQIRDIKHIQLILFLTIAGAAFVVVIAFFQAWGWNPLKYNSPGFPAASFINKNHLANYIDLLIPLALFILISTRSNKKKYLVSISISIFFSYIIFSHTRASWLSLIIVFTFILFCIHRYKWIQEKFKMLNYKHIIIMVLLSFFLINSSNNNSFNEEHRFKNLYSSLNDTEVISSTSMRINAYKNATQMFYDAPYFGTGLGSFQIAFKPYDKRKNSETSSYAQLHNDPLQIFIELGLFGALLVISFIVIIVYQTYTLINSSSRTQNDTLILIGLSFALAVSILHSFLDFPLHLPASSFLIFLFIGFLLRTNVKKTKTTWKIKSLLFFTLIVISTLNLAFYSSFASSSYYLNKAIKILFIHHPKYQYKPIQPINNKLCKAAVLNTNKSLEYFSNDHNIHNWSYVIYKECVKNHDKFLALSNKVLQNNPYHRVALENTAFTMFNKNNFSSAKHYYKILHYVYPLNAGYSLLLGHIAVKQKNYTDANKYYLKTLALAPDNTVAPKMINKLIEKGYVETKATVKN